MLLKLHSQPFHHQEPIIIYCNLNCVAPRPVDASRDFYFIFSPNGQRGGGGGAAGLFFFSPLFSRPRAGLATV